ncbi:hypothetical protein E0L21_22480 [Kosakonia quasisacchari]|uniref:SLATT domain-containing protein n=1 Tax=Kosakonia quasisacchari TaxID=2529380 RepID=A0A4R0GQU8_9ENTR|nr:hypothetical protein [Kosakonia quasisacchari]TCB98139.1 hypothetical protein E0L21_22480 [Kosakonia quasisacchari]
MSEEQKAYEAVKEYDEIIQENFRNSLIDSASLATIETTTILDKFSMWLLVGVGATATLMIANIDKILPFITPFGFKISVFFLALSSLAGFLSKYYALVVFSAATVTVRMTELIQSKSKEYEEQCKKRDEMGRKIGYVSEIEVSLESFIDQYINLFPFQWLRNKIRKRMSVFTVSKSGNKSAVHGVVFQSIALLLQSLSYIAFLIVVTYFINLH